MNFADLLKAGQLVKEDTSRQKIAEFLQFAEEELSAARYNLDKFPLTAYKSAYDSLMHAGCALIRYYGFRPTSTHTHVTVTEFVDRVLSEDFGHLVATFKRMRRKRHPLQYDARFSESRSEVKSSIAQAELLLKKIEEHIKIKPAQPRLF